jgi:hypothetical protein
VEIINVHVGKIGKGAVALIFGEEKSRLGQDRRIDAAFFQGRHHGGRRVYLDRLHVGGIHVPAAQHDQQHQMRRRAEAGDTDFFAAEILRPFELVPSNDSLHALVDDGGDHDHVGAAQAGVDHAATAAGEKLHIARNQRAHPARRCAAHHDDFRVDAVFLENSPVLGDPQGCIDWCERAETDAETVGGAGGGIMQNCAKKQREAVKDEKSRG